MVRAIQAALEAADATFLKYEGNGPGVGLRLPATPL
jgi:hypothetical protein